MKTYAIGDISFDACGQEYCESWIMGSIEECVEWRKAAGASYPREILHIDPGVIKIIPVAYGMMRGRKRKMILVVRRIGSYTEF